MSVRTLNSRFRGRGTQFHVELLYGVLFIVGFGYLVFRVDPRVAAFEGGLVVGYLLRIWEKMSIYERILEEVVSEEAETQVATELEAQVPEEVQTEVEEQVPEEVQTELEEQVADEVRAEVEEQVPEEVQTELEEQVGDEVDQQLGERVEEEVSETVDDHIEETVDTELEERLPENFDSVDEFVETLDDRDGAPDVDELVVEGEVEDLVAEEVDAALEEEDGRSEG